MLNLRTADLDKRERVKGTGSLVGAEAESNRMISIEGVAVKEVWGYRFSELEKAENEMALHSYSNGAKSPRFSIMGG